MRTVILSLALLLFTACIGDKEPKKEIPQELNTTQIDTSLGTLTIEQVQLKSALTNYIAQIKTLNADNILNMTYPKLFIPINKDMFRDYLNTMLISSDIQITSFEALITDIGDVKPFDNGSFSQVAYNSTIIINFINPELYDSQRKLLILDKILSNKYGRENILVDSVNRNITIKKEERMIAIKENGSDWKFLGDNAEYRRLYHKILPIDILNNII